MAAVTGAAGPPALQSARLVEVALFRVRSRFGFGAFFVRTAYFFRRAAPAARFGRRRAHFFSRAALAAPLAQVRGRQRGACNQFPGALPISGGLERRNRSQRKQRSRQSTRRACLCARVLLSRHRSPACNAASQTITAADPRWFRRQWVPVVGREGAGAQPYRPAQISRRENALIPGAKAAEHRLKRIVRHPVAVLTRARGALSLRPLLLRLGTGFLGLGF